MGAIVRELKTLVDSVTGNFLGFVDGDGTHSMVPRTVTDDNGNTIGIAGPDGVVIPIPAVVDAGVATTTLTLAAGERNSLALSSGYYRVDPDMDVYVKGSNASSLYGAELTDDVDAYSTTTGTLAAQTGLDFGTANFSFEGWIQLDSSTPNGARIFGFGGASGTAGTGRAQIDIYAAVGATDTGLNLDIGFNGPDGVAIEAFGNNGVISGYPLGSTLYHIVCTVARGAPSATGTATWYINGAQVRTDTWTEAATVAALNLNTNDGASSRLCIGGTVGGNAEWDGRIEDIKFYKTLLTLSQVQARNNAGPLRTLGTDAADASLSWWINFQQSGTWANPLYPQCVSGYGNAVFNSLIGSPAVTERTLGAAAASTDNKIYAGKPEVVGLTNTYMGFYSDSLSAGSVRLTKVA